MSTQASRRAVVTTAIEHPATEACCALFAGERHPIRRVAPRPDGRVEARAVADLARENFPPERIATVRTAGMRYRGQSYEVGVPVPPLRDAAGVAALAQQFHVAHRRRYGHMAEAEAIEIVNFQVTAIGQMPRPVMPTFPKAGSTSQPHDTREAHFGDAALLQVPVFRRSDLGHGVVLEGPAIIEEKTSTVVLYPGHAARVDEYLNIEITVR